MKKLLLADQGKACVPITIPADAGEVIIKGAKELAHYLERITGADFAIGYEAQEKDIDLQLDSGLEEEEFSIAVSSEQGIGIRGGSARGLLYGVYSLLEDVLGVRFFTADVTHIPVSARLEVEEMICRDKPALEYRQIDYPPCMYPEWRARNRLNGMGGPVHAMDPFGGMKTYALFVHTFNRLVDPEIYFDTHPEYFSLVNGERKKRDGQLCLTNTEVIRIATESVRTILRQHPEARMISVSQNDTYSPCECPECARIDEENGSHAGSLLYFVNAIAAAIEDEFPHVIVDTLAYQYTRRPPAKIRPRQNVCVRLCSIECCFGHPLECCDQVMGPFRNHEETSASCFQQDLVGWGKICDRIYIWDYVTNFRYYWLPFPNFHVIRPNMQFFVKNGVKGVYEEGNYQSVSPDMVEMRTWLLAKLLWNPDFDVQKGIEEFTEAVYGPAAEEIRAYVALLERRVTEGNIHFGIYDQPDIGYLDEETLKKARHLMAGAQEKPLTLSQRIYVEKAALSVEFAAVGQQVLEGNRNAARIDAMMETARSLGITRISEIWEWNKAYQSMLEGRMLK